MQPAQPRSVEVRKTRPCELDLRTNAFKRSGGLLPRLCDTHRIVRDEYELWAARQRLAQSHPRGHACCLRGTRDIPDLLCAVGRRDR